MWLFGQLNTIGESEVQRSTDENARVVGQLLKQLVERQQQDGVAKGHGEAEGVVNGR